MGDHNRDERSIPVPLKSRNSNWPAYVSFINSTDRLANIIWINFQGQKSSYTAEGLSPGHRLDMKTFMGHPWIARDFQTGIVLEFLDQGAGKSVYMPEKWDGSRNYRAPLVKIRIPMFSLYERTLEVVCTLLRSKDNVDELEIPKQIKYDLNRVMDAAP